MIPDSIRFPGPEEFCFQSLIQGTQRCLLGWRGALMSQMTLTEMEDFQTAINEVAHLQFNAPLFSNRALELPTINDQYSFKSKDGPLEPNVSVATARERLSRLFRTACVKAFGFVVDASGKTGHIPKAPEPTPEPTPEPERVEQRELVAV